MLVTGGAGFIGSHLCDELIKTSKVICIDDFSTGDERNIDHLLADPDFEFIKHDINEPLELEKMRELQKFKIEFQGIQEIYHLACPMSPKDFEKNTIKTALSNSVGMVNMLDLAVRHEAKFAHFSSSVVYGEFRDSGVKVGEEYQGIVNHLSKSSAYDEGKRFAETLVYNYQEVFKLDAKIIRVFRIYGPRMKLNDWHMIPDFINNAIDGKDLVIYGDKDFASSFCYVSDCVDAALKLMETDIREPINIGSDVKVNLEDLGRKIIGFIGSKSNIVNEEGKLFVRPLSIPDTTKARNIMSWLPIVTLDRGLEATINELRSRKGMKSLDDAI